MENKDTTSSFMVGFDMGTSGLKCVEVNPAMGATIVAYTDLTAPFCTLKQTS